MNRRAFKKWRCILCGATGGCVDAASALAAHERAATRPHQAQLVITEEWTLEPDFPEEQTLP